MGAPGCLTGVLRWKVFFSHPAEGSALYVRQCYVCRPYGKMRVSVSRNGVTLTQEAYDGVPKWQGGSLFTSNACLSIAKGLRSPGRTHFLWPCTLTEVPLWCMLQQAEITKTGDAERTDALQHDHIKLTRTISGKLDDANDR